MKTLTKSAFANSEIKRILMGIPDGHQHIRTLIETINGDQFLLQEATIANIVRAYTVIKTHPQKRALELEQKQLPEQKEGYAAYQLIETEKDEKEITKELAIFASNSNGFTHELAMNKDCIK